jgi:sigma-E factor negative regulatory protein RseA
MKENISQLMDGELDERASATAFDSLQRDREALEVWRTYHVISDAMRDTPRLSEDFAARFAARLAAEPTVLAPARRARPPRLVWAAVASLAGVGLVAWLAFAPQPQPPAPQLAQAAPAAAKPPVVIVRTLPRMANDYLLAHQGFSPRVYLHGMAPYVRTVSEPADEPGK